MVIVSAYKTTKYTIPIPTQEDKIYEAIRNGKWEKVVTVARSKKEDGKDVYDEYRTLNVPCWTPALNIKAEGKANYTTDDFVGRFALDVDDLKEDQNRNRQILINQQWAISVFTSIGGEGLCVIGKCDPTRFKESVDSAIEILKRQGVTAMGSQYNPNRLRYVSYDPDLYYNPNTATEVPILKFNSTVRTAEVKDLENSTNPIHNEGVNDEEIFKKIVEIKSAGGEVWSEGTRHGHLISIITFCNKIGMNIDFVHEAAEKYCRPMMENGFGYDISKRVNDIYSEYAHEHNTKQWNNKKKEMDDSLTGFWEVNEKNSISIIRTRLIKFLSNQGFGLYYLDGSKKAFEFIKSTNRQIEIVNATQITQHINNFINRLPEEFDGITRDKLQEVFYRQIDTFSSKTFLSLLPATDPDFLKDTRDFSYFSFRNGAIEVGTGGLLRSVSYEDLKKDVWKSQVIDFDIKIDPEFNIMDGGEYAQFIQKVTADDATRYMHAMTITGYVLHRYKDPARPFGIILAEETEDEDQGGGTGKGIYVKGISKLRNIITVDGKTDKADKSFRWQRVTPDTEGICVEDCNKRINFEDYYPVITEGITIEKKNQQEVFIPYDFSPKILFTTNFTIPNIGNHAKRRQRVLEFANFFSPKRTPENHFGHLLFTDWDTTEWNRFYNFMFWCVGMYLNDGIRDMDNSISIRRKQVRQNFSEEFLDWFDGYAANGRGDYKLFSDLYNQFVTIHDIEVRDYSKKRFKKGLEDTSSLFGYRLEKELSKAEATKNKPMYRVIDLEKSNRL